MKDSIQKLIQLADTLDNQGLTILANKIDDILAEIVESEKDPIDSILYGYQTMHTAALGPTRFKPLHNLVSVILFLKEVHDNIAQESYRNRLLSAADIVRRNDIIPEDIYMAYQYYSRPRRARKHIEKAIKDLTQIVQDRSYADKKEVLEKIEKASIKYGVGIIKHGECPLCLSVPQACQNAGDSVLAMKAGSCSTNHKIYDLQHNGLKCKYAVRVLPNYEAVECSCGSSTEGVAVPRMYRSSPIYPKLWEGFNTVNLDRNYHQYSDFNYFSIYG